MSLCTMPSFRPNSVAARRCGEMPTKLAVLARSLFGDLEPGDEVLRSTNPNTTMIDIVVSF